MKLSEWAREYGTILGVRTGYVVDYYVNSDKMVKVSETNALGVVASGWRC